MGKDNKKRNLLHIKPKSLKSKGFECILKARETRKNHIKKGLKVYLKQVRMGRDMVKIEKIIKNKKQFLDLLLLADEQENMIDKYLPIGDLFALYDGDLKSVCVVAPINSETCELKNIATYEKYQGKGYGRALINYIFDFYKNDYKTMLVGTGETPTILSFYESCGFKKSHRVKNFFTDNYDHPIFEGDIQLVDMIYLKKDL